MVPVMVFRLSLSRFSTHSNNSCSRKTAIEKVRKAEDGWNTRDPHRVSVAYAVDCHWRNRAEFPIGWKQIVEFLTRKWNREFDYRLIKELWAFTGNRIAVRFGSVPYSDFPGTAPLTKVFRHRSIRLYRKHDSWSVIGERRENSCMVFISDH